MSKNKEHKIKRMRKKRVWPSILLTLFSFTISSFLVICLIIGICYIKFNEKKQRVQDEAISTNYLIDEYMSTKFKKASIIKSEITNELTSFDNKDKLLSKLKTVVEKSDCIDAGIWTLDAKTPYSISEIKYSLESSFYQEFLKGKEGIYSEETKQGKLLIYTSIINLKENQKALFFLVEDARLNFEGITNTQKNAETYVMNLKNEVVAKLGNNEDNIYNKGLLIGNDDKQFNRILSMTKEEKVYLVNCEGILSTRSGNEESIDFKPSFLLNSNNIILKNPFDATLRIEKDINLNGWRTVSYRHIIFNRSEINQLLHIMILALIILLIPHIIMIFMIISQFISRKKLTDLLYLDSVTGGKNWLHFKLQATKILKKRKYRDYTYAIAAFKVNHFRIFCDYNGISKGDDLLENINQQLQTIVNKGETYGRYAEAQFSILLQYQTEEQLKDRIQSMLNIFSNCTKEKISFAAGVYLIEDKNILMDNLYIFASGARDSIIGQLETQIVMFDSKIRDKQLREKEIEDNMGKALANNEFAVYLQPKYSTTTEVISGAEALVRWISPNKGIISPGLFIPVFEKNGFITKLDDYMLSSVAKLQAQWIKEGKNVIPISVNISRIHFANPNLAEHICETVDAYGTPHNVIELELTESAFFDDKNILLNTVRKLKEYGFTVSMDDFGAGYSSLNSLKDLPLDVVKLDGEFFRESEDKERGETIVTYAIHLAKNLNMRIVAEGIETREQVDFLTRSGCDLIQGFYFAKPMPVEEFINITFN